MESVTIDDVDSRAGPADVKRPLSRALGASDLACNYYELAPGDSFAFGYHRHPEQEEVFVILAGTVTFQTEDGPVDVAEGEAIRFAPGEWQRGSNAGDERVRALALGAPADAGEAEVLRDCPDCGESTEQRIERAPEDADAALVTRCAVCGATTGEFS